MALTGMALAAALGLLKSEMVDRPKEDRQRKLRAEEQRLSPWSKLGVTQNVQEADPFGSALEFGATGAMMGRGVSNDNMNKAMVAQQMAKGANNTGGQNPWANVAAPSNPNYLGVDSGGMNAYPQYKNTNYWGS